MVCRGSRNVATVSGLWPSNKPRLVWIILKVAGYVSILGGFGAASVEGVLSAGVRPRPLHDLWLDHFDFLDMVLNTATLFLHEARV